MRAGFVGLVIGRGLFGLVALGLVRPAAADPSFVMLDRYDGSSTAGGEFTYLFPSTDFDSLGVDATAFRFEVHGQYVDRASGFGGYYGGDLGAVLRGRGDAVHRRDPPARSRQPQRDGCGDHGWHRRAHSLNGLQPRVGGRV